MPTLVERLACRRVHALPDLRGGAHAYLDVDERGTEAAALTALAFEVVITPAGPPPIKFFVDRPFLFAVRDEKTGTLLFVGLIASP